MTAVAVDTNVLVYAVDADAPQHGPSRALADAAVQGKISAAVFPQVLLEFYAVVTDPGESNSGPSSDVNQPSGASRSRIMCKTLGQKYPTAGSPGQQGRLRPDRGLIAYCLTQG